MHLLTVLVGVVDVHDCGQLVKRCPFCRALHFPLEKECCCSEGKVWFAELPKLPAFLHWLLTSDNQEAFDFRKNINAYNTLLSFASRMYNTVSQPGGVQIGKQTGSTFHLASALYPPDGKKPLFGNCFLLDPDEAAAARMENHMASKNCKEWVSHNTVTNSQYPSDCS